MGLFDGYFDPQQFGEGGGLLGRLLALQQMQRHEPGVGFDPQPSATGQAPSMPQAPASSNTGRAGVGNEAMDGQPLGLSKIGYFEFPTNANQAFGELSDIRDREQRDTVSSDDYLSGVREGNVRRNQDGSLDVTNGTVVTLSLKDGRAKTVTVTNADIAHIDGTTGEVVIQKSPLGKGI
jgi:hypothetical protein